MVVGLGYGWVSAALGGLLGRGFELIGVALGCGCGLIDLVVGCSGLLWVMLWVEVVGCVVC